MWPTHRIFLGQCWAKAPGKEQGLGKGGQIPSPAFTSKGSYLSHRKGGALRNSPSEMELARNRFSFFFFLFFLIFRATSESFPKLGVQWELPAYTTATARSDPNRVCDLHHSSQKGWILNPLSEARD